MSDTVLVTGGAGFIGSNLVRALLEAGDTVRVLDNFSTGSRSNLDGLDDVELIEGDLLSYERVYSAVKGCDVVLHLGALPSVPRSVQDPITSTNVNVMGTMNVLLCARHEDVRRVVFASSSSVYGANDALPKRETMRPMPISPYAAAKLSGEALCSSFSAVYGLETVSLRFFNVFGPRQSPHSQYSAVIPRFITAAMQRKPLSIYGDGTQSRDFTFVDDVVTGIRAASHPGAPGEGHAVNLACGDRHSLLVLAETIGELLGVTPELEFMPSREGDVPHSQADASLAKSLFGWESQHSFREGLARTIEWMVGA